jgi:hypothetical protein
MSGESFLQGAFIGAMCWLAGSVIWDSIERYRRDKANRIREQLVYSSPQISPSGSSFGKAEPQVRIGQMNALNGRLLEVSTTRLNKHGDRDFVVEHYIVDETKPLSEQIAVVMLMKGLEK